MNLFNIRRTFVELRPIRKWKTIYWLIDVHGVIIPGSWKSGNEFRFISNDAIEVLQWISDRKDQKMILWTSSYAHEVVQLFRWLSKYNILVDAWNNNPWEKNTEYADFREKPYFNILLDDKAGFSPETDWKLIKEELIDIGEWNTLQ